MYRTKNILGAFATFPLSLAKYSCIDVSKVPDDWYQIPEDLIGDELSLKVKLSFLLKVISA